MLELITKGIAKIFGTKSERDIKTLWPIVHQINAEFDKLSSLSDDELRDKTQNIIERINDSLKDIDNNIEELHKKVEEHPSMSLTEKEGVFNQIDSLEDKRNEKLEEVLNTVLPEAFAIVKETGRRYKENKFLKVKATIHDRKIATMKHNVEIDGDYAIWHNEWDAAGTTVTWDMVHYDVQLIGGIVLHQGKISEMATGEGKTLVATLPAFLNALAKRGVHVVTVNDYLAKRDSEWMAPLFEFHQLTIDCIDKYQPNSEERRNAYQADITYGTNNEFGFDYLRDNMTREVKELVQRKRHHYAMVDEVDSVLIDDARTPLIISGPIPKGDEHEFYELKPRVSLLVDAQRKLASQFLLEAKKLIKEGDENEGGLALFRAYRALPKHKPLIKFLSEQGIRQILQKTENYYLADNARLMPEADEPLYFIIEEKHNSIDMTEKGIDLITGQGSDPNFFVMPDLAIEIDKLDKDTELDEASRVEKKDAIIRDYSVKAERIHSVNQLLKAYTLFEKDQEYIVQDDKVMIVDEQTGRVMDGRRFSDGLHQALEAKENVKVEDATQTYATVTLQNYFRMYHKLSGMTGTAETEAGELWEIYKLDVVMIPTNKKIQRDDREDKVYKTVREKFNAVADEIVELTNAGRPVLVGTTSVEISELLSRMLQMKKIKHQVLNAKQHAREADVVALAGQPGTVTIATNMAGRGTDIKLSQESRAAGGLAIIGTERHESRRVDRQLRGRAGRQGDVGSSQFFVSLEDNLMRLFGSERIAKLMDRLGLEEGEVIQHSMITKSIERAQKKVEENNFGIRKRLLEYDDIMNHQREVIYKRRRNALYGERLKVDILNSIYDTCDDIVNECKDSDDYETFRIKTATVLGLELPISADEFSKIDKGALLQQLNEKALSNYEAKNQSISERAFPIIKQVFETRGATVRDILVPFTDGQKQIGISSNLEKNVETNCKALIDSLEKNATLSIIDQTWKEHLRDMDDLKQSVQNAVYEQKDPLLIYKFESFELFKQFLAKVNSELVSFLMKATIPVQESTEVHEDRQKQVKQEYTEEKEEVNSALNTNTSQESEPAPKQQPVRSEKVHGRNDRVKVQYADGTVKEDVKFKSVENDLRDGKCVIIE
ncbi:preprotein translocase subunit SecA [Aureibacter tunicatorum]|uniref:Protein translocase subunit SecA n=1 Tax=Aureibacter tunicatorum TaxID=866807 RepID=A0AAE3XJI7_9BACT|nr:preprotein translocase subunit SecA [Aureibacter tunicatorum]MDR6237605.1 preprotein translocase subunit SecA [Aureibacter tunicatorum]BDD02639.1 protein translocase subunit SecA [Aureibacter tunicatorum]